MKEAAYYGKNETNTVQCGLCPHNCVISPGKAGICRARKNEGGRLVSLSYGQITSLNLDPIEKKPLYHFHPGSMILSAGSFGCNLRCSFCQNWEISQAGAGDIPARNMQPDSALRMAKESGSIGLAYTYNEPLMNWEWVIETAKLLSEAGMKNVLVTNGFINQAPWEELLRYIDAANIDIKSFNGGFYSEMCGAKLEPVKKAVEIMSGMGKHVELTALLIPGKNDSVEEIEKLAGWAASISDRIPLHFSRYFPQYKLELPPTGITTLKLACEAAKKKLKYVYLGNVPEHEYSDTICPSCGAQVIRRNGYNTDKGGLAGKNCAACGASCDIIM